MAKHRIGYASMDEAIKDGFKKVGGKEQAIDVLQSGWYAVQERKIQNEKNKALKDAMKKDPRFESLRQQVKKQLEG